MHSAQKRTVNIMNKCQLTEKYRHVTISTEVVNTYSRMIHNHLANNQKAIYNHSQGEAA